MVSRLATDRVIRQEVLPLALYSICNAERIERRLSPAAAVVGDYVFAETDDSTAVKKDAGVDCGITPFRPIRGF